jgi:hypothetical protein
MSFKEDQKVKTPVRGTQKVKELVTLVVNTARAQGLRVTEPTEVYIIEECRVALESNVLKADRDVVVGAAGLIAGGFEVMKKKSDNLITIKHVDEAFQTVLRQGINKDIVFDDLCTFIMHECLFSTVVKREDFLKDRLKSFRSLLEAVGEEEASATAEERSDAAEEA